MEHEKKRNNHYVPQMYLKQWSNNGNTVWTYDTIVWNEHQDVWKSNGVGGLAYFRDFYSQSDDEEEVDDSIERLFGDEYEWRAGEALRKVRDREPLAQDDMDALVDFAILQMVRTPLWYMYMSLLAPNHFVEACRETLDKLESDLRMGMLTKERVREKIESAPDTAPFPNWDIGVDIDEKAETIKLSLSVGRKNYLAWIGQVLNGNVGKCMRGHSWSVVEMPEGVTLPTCDNPFVRLCVGRDGRPSLNGGVGVAGTDLFMPLTPKHLLFTEVGGGKLDTQRLSDDPVLVRLIKGSIVQNAMRYVYDSHRSDWIVRLRPRRVDPEHCKMMADIREHWNDMQN